MMKDVTLSPGMGAYLNMLNSAKPGTINGVAQIANENYARELMQLFTIGLDMLNQDGCAATGTAETRFQRSPRRRCRRSRERTRDGHMGNRVRRV